MARYERDYGRDFGRWGNRNTPLGGMRSDGGWGGGDWRSFPGEEGWYGEGYEGMPGNGFGRSGRTHWQGNDRDFPGGYGGRSEWERGYEGGYGGLGRSRGYRGDLSAGGYGSTPETGYGGRDLGYGADTWGDRWGGWGSGREGGFGPSRAAEIMTENPETVTADASIADVAKKMRDLDVGIIPVVDSSDNRRLRGVITDRDITVRAIAQGKDGAAKVADCMTDRVRSVNKNDSVHEVMRVMREEQVRRVPVTDREGRLVGIIAQADLAVDFASHDSSREMEVGETVERISEPARPSRESTRMSASARNEGSTAGRGKKAST